MLGWIFSDPIAVSIALRINSGYESARTSHPISALAFSFRSTILLSCSMCEEAVGRPAPSRLPPWLFFSLMPYYIIYFVVCQCAYVAMDHRLEKPDTHIVIQLTTSTPIPLHSAERAAQTFTPYASDHLFRKSIRKSFIIIQKNRA